MNLSLALLLQAAHGEAAEHGAEHEESISEVVMHHISNADLADPALAGPGDQ